ncbi:hypothetical protein FHS19_004176 [Paenibacillus rhizosphaerae]|uniref:Thymidylate kinase n=1 Tax=Paenibacillus rhizosphaerae TaxID=297318 RepID=A0A839TSH9_9BACL|nr:hypothetical protein [Paenibacillus rhizosphaerae]MBB3129501.1 hypothetical protein [Paenibacillus rhizosphaerae]
MSQTKLILVEGIPGSGKTSTARYIKGLLDAHGKDNPLYLEGDLNHPADYESVACLDSNVYKILINKYPELSETLDSFTQTVRQYQLIYYGKLQQQISMEKYKHIIDEISGFDVYNGSLDRYQELIMERWTEFVTYAQQSERIVILECCFLQNPLTMMFGRFNQSKQMITDFIKRIETMIQPLDPKIIYFYQDDIKSTINRVIQERSDEWLRHITRYFTEQGYGKAKGYHGVDGLCEVLKVRKEYELDIMDQLKIDKLTINNTEFDWEPVLQEVRGFLEVAQ